LVLRERSRTAAPRGRESRRKRESNLDGAEVGESEVEALADAVGGAVAVKLEHPVLLLLLVGRGSGSGSMRCGRGRAAAESWTGLVLLRLLLDWEVELRLVMLTSDTAAQVQRGKRCGRVGLGEEEES
jgi:hypothetical protein